MPKIFVTSSTMRDVKAVPLSVISVVGRYVCRVMMSMRTFAVLMAEASVTGYAKRYREKTSKAVMMFSYPPLGGRFGNRSICKASSGPRSHSGKFSNSGVIDAFAIRLSLMQISHPWTHFLTIFATPG